MADAILAPASTLSVDREVLPSNLKPTHYDLRVEPDTEEAKEFDGSVSIAIDVIEETSSIVLNAVDLEILETEVIADGKKIPVGGLDFDAATERMTIRLEQELSVGAKVLFKQTYKGSLLHSGLGFFRSPVKIDNKTTWVLSTQLQATDARRVFPSFDEPALKATFGVTLVADRHLTCLSNMDVSSESLISSNGKDKKVVNFNTTPVMTVYLVCFAIGDLQMVETNSFRVPIRVYAAKDKNIEHGRYFLEHASKTLDVFEKMFDIDYPLPKLDMLAVSGQLGAMENWGLVTYVENRILVDEDESSASAFRSAGKTMVHELAHQWFGNLVTMEFWDGLWLNEGFADWAELHAWESLDPSWQMGQSFTSGPYQSGLQLDSNRASHPVEVPVQKVSEINQIFDSISYDKGCSVLKMIANFVGVDVFVKGVQNYLKKHAYGNTTSSDLWQALGDASGQDVQSIMEIWTKNMGYPYIKVDEDKDSITLTQHRFLQDGTCEPEDDKILFPLSLRVRTRTGIEDDYVLNERSKTFKISSDFFKLNADQAGFYRVLYTPQRLEVLGQNVKDGLLSADDRIGLISDAQAMASSGNAKTSSVLNLLTAFEDEENFFVWRQLLASLDKIIQAWTFEDASVVASLTRFQTRLVQKCLAKKGWSFDGKVSGVEKMFKALIFSHSGQDEKAQKAAKDMFDAFLGGDDGAININIQSAVLQIALEHGGEKEYDAVMQAVSKTTSIDRRDSCLEALGYARQPSLIQRTIEFAVSPDMVGQSGTTRILKSVASHRAGIEALWHWLRTDLEKIKKIFGESGIGSTGRMVTVCMMSLATRKQWEEVKTFFQGTDTKAFDSYLAQSLDTILAKATWVERDSEDMKQWLSKNGYLEK
ncbi:aminopeptidase 2 [Phlyctema vagabunda]|uniref:Aminopeptidase n=1 Tax=Phlyctema vagabunda TaxID=108571 RepID=A0ABR4PH83_9HELO